MVNHKVLSPYVVGSPVKGENFFGRQLLLDKCNSALLSAGSTSIVVVGLRRSGKTSVLLELQRRLLLQDTPAVYIAINPFEPMTDLLKIQIAEPLSELLEIDFDTISQNTFSDANNFKRKFLPLLYKKLKPHQKIVMLFDEFDTIDLNPHSEQTKSIGSNLLSAIKNWMPTEQRIAFAFAMGREVHNTNSIDALRTSQKFPIKNLRFSEAEELIKTPSEGILNFSPSALKNIYDSTNGHAVSIQMICSLIFERKRIEQHPILILPDDIQATFNEAIDRIGNIYDWIWEGLSSAERIVVSMVAELTKQNKMGVTKNYILNGIQEQADLLKGVPNEIDVAPNELAFKDILIENDGDFSISIPLFREWIYDSHRFNKVFKEEFPFIGPANEMYKAGVNASNKDAAKIFYQQAIDQNPSHAQARVNLAKIYSDEGKIDDAITQLEEAYIYHYGSNELIEALYKRSSSIKNDEMALQDYYRILQIRPGEIPAKKAITTAWLKRGKNCETLGKLIDAIQAYKLAEDSIGLRRVYKALVENAEAKEDWETASEIYNNLVAIDPKNASTWNEKYTTAREKIIDRNLFKEAESLFDNEKFAESLERLLPLIRSKPNYGNGELARLVKRIATNFYAIYGKNIIQLGKNEVEFTNNNEWFLTTCEQFMETKFPIINSSNNLGQAIFIMEATQTKYLPVIDNDVLVGIVTSDDIAKRLSENINNANITVKEVMFRMSLDAKKESRILNPEDSLLVALNYLKTPIFIPSHQKSRYTDCLAVVKNDILIGLLSYKNILIAIDQGLIPIRELVIKNIILDNPNLKTLDINASLSEAYWIIINTQQRAIPIVDKQNRTLRGLVTINDVFRVLSRNNKVNINLPISTCGIMTKVEYLDTLSEKSHLKLAVKHFLRKPFPDVLAITKNQNNSFSGLISHNEIINAIEIP